jgi:TIR domain
MATAKEYFEKDLSRVMRVHAVHTAQSGEGVPPLEVIAAVALDFEAGSRYGAILLPDVDWAAHIAAHYLQHVEDLLKVADGVDVIQGFAGTAEAVPLSDLLFSGRILIYTAANIPAHVQQELNALARDRGLRLIIRDRSYMEARSRLEIPLAFISHDSRDKEPLVRELASTLQKMLCPVWYDEYSLIAGQSLRESIEKGLRECRKCVLILSENFLSNKGWTKAEFDSVFTREILEQQNVIVPVWHGVSKEQIYTYSPRLLDKVGIPSTVGVEEIARRIVRAVQHVA